jgi:hypothetical protein
VLAELARSCGYQVEVEPRFPSIVEMRFDRATGEFGRHIQPSPLAHGDLLLVRGSTRLLIDVTVPRPTTLTLLNRGSTNSGAHLIPLVAATLAEKHKHTTYDAECSKHGWKMVPFALESLGAKGTEATQLLKRMSAHSTDLSPAAFLLHADRMLSSALQVGNAHVATQGASDLLLHAYRVSCGLTGAAGSSNTHTTPGRYQQRRAEQEAAVAASTADGLGSIVHADYCCARAGVRTGMAA